MANNKEINIRGSRKGDIEQLGYNFENTFKGRTVEKAGKVLVVAGVLYTEPKQVVSYMDDEIRKNPKTIMKVAKEIMQLCCTYDEVLVAIADPTERNSQGFLQHLGFIHHQTSDLGEVYIWHKQQQY